MKRIMIVPVAVLTITGALLFGATTTQAYLRDGGTSDTLIQKIAQKFGVKEADVKVIFDQERTAMEKQMQAKQEERLTQLVIDEKITEAQKKLIIAKQAELHAARAKNFEEMKTMTPEQRKAAMDAQKTSLDEWAKTNGIDPQYLMGRFKMKFHGRAK